MSDGLDTWGLQPVPENMLSLLAMWSFAAVYLTLYYRDKEPGFGALGSSFFFLGMFYGCPDSTDSVTVHPATGLVLELAVLLRVIAVRRYLSPPIQCPKALRWALPAIPVVLMVTSALGAHAPLKAVAVLNVLPQVGLAWLAARAARRERGAGHELIAVTLVLVPLMVLAVSLFGLSPLVLRNFGPIPSFMFGLTMMVTTLWRRKRDAQREMRRVGRMQQRLEKANSTLETEVARKTEDLRAVIAGLESFNRQVSHDLRGPIGGIEQLAELACEAQKRGDLAVSGRMLAAISTQAGHSVRLLQGLLSLARAGQSKLEMVLTDTARIVQDCLESALRIDKDPATPAGVCIGKLPSITTDPNILRTIFQNLISNAVKFSAGKEVEVEVGATSEGNDSITFFVSDHGVGFDPARAQEIFQPFVRLGNARVEGHGIGLSVVKTAVQRLGGSLRAEAKPGQGATFFVTLPGGSGAAPSGTGASGLLGGSD